VEREHRPFGHIDSLDGLRGLAAAIVLIGHTNVVLTKSLDTLNIIRHSPLAILINGFGAVHLFFILSGFCLASSAARCGSPSDLSQFYVRRVFRIHPPYMFALLATWFASFAYDGTQANGGLTRWMLDFTEVHLSVPDLLLFLCYPSPAGNQLPVAWSMTVEMIFSFLLPLMVWVVRRTHWAVLLAVSTYPMIVTSFKPGILRYGVYFAIGIALFEERERLSRWLAQLSATKTLLFVVAGLAFFASTTMFGLFYKTSGPILSAIGGTLLVSGAVFLPRMRGLLSSPVLVHFGRISYSFYLFHFTVLILCSRMITGPASLLDALALLALSFVITTACAELAYRAAERPSILLGNAICRMAAAWTGQSAQLSGLAR
jgi:peptidoglycan/LPS O-acetylase OafA/YrhL